MSTVSHTVTCMECSKSEIEDKMNQLEFMRSLRLAGWKQKAEHLPGVGRTHKWICPACVESKKKTWQ